MKRQLFIMVKEPHPGRVKTRLGMSIGYVSAAWWFRQQTKRLIRRLALDPRWETILCVSPDVEGLESRVWPHYIRRIPQGGGDLGDRMARVLRNGDVGASIIIGADIPGIQPSDIAAAFKALGKHQSVFGPAPDGGYWLVGVRHVAALPKSAFKAVRWSTKYALKDTAKSFGELSLGYVRELRDVDTVDDL